VQKFRVVLDITVDDERYGSPGEWRWHTLLDLQNDEKVTLISTTPVPEA
jgi:hypothetical protein